MSYGSAPEDERILSYSSSASAKSSTPNHHTSLPMPSSSAPPASASAPTAAPLPDDPTSDFTATSIIGTPSAAADRALSFANATWQACRPWPEFYSTAAISIPQFPTLSDRFSTNLHLYRANYFVLASFWLVIFFLGSIPSFLIAAVCFVLIERWCTRRALKCNGSLPHRDMIIAAFLALIVIWLTGIAEQALLSLGLSSIFVAAHAALHEPPLLENEIATV